MTNIKINIFVYAYILGRFSTFLKVTFFNVIFINFFKLYL